MKSNLLSGLLIAAGAFAFTTAPADEQRDPGQAEASACFQTKRVHTIRRLDEFHVIAELLGGKRYVLGVEDRCRGLESAVRFTITSRGTRVCSNSFAELIFAERSNRTDQCRIETVELLNDESREEDAGNAAAEKNRND